MLTLSNDNDVAVNYVLLAFEEASVIELKEGRMLTMQRKFMDSRMHFYYPITTSKELLLLLSATSGDVAMNASLFAPEMSLPKDMWPYPAKPSLPAYSRTSGSLKFSSEVLGQQCGDYTECYVLVSLALGGETEEDGVEEEEGYLFDLVEIVAMTDSVMLKDGEKAVLHLSANETRLVSYDLAATLSSDASLELALEGLTGSVLAYLSVSSNEHPNYPSQGGGSLFLYESQLLDAGQLADLLQSGGVLPADSGVRLLL